MIKNIALTEEYHHIDLKFIESNQDWSEPSKLTADRTENTKMT